MIKIVVADIDNTLTVKHRDISDYTRNIINELQANGILFGLASGRDIESLHQLEDKWDIKADLLIGNNGSEYYDGILDKHHVFYMMDKEWIRKTFEIMQPFKYKVWMKNGDTFYNSDEKAARNSSKYMNGEVKVKITKNPEDYVLDGSFKIGFRVSEEDMPAIEKRVASYELEGFKGVKTESTMYEFCNALASKGKLLEEFGRIHNINKDEIASFGDMSNDISLFEVSGMAVCMINGSNDAKSKANHISDKDVDHDGFADYVDRYILKGE